MKKLKYKHGQWFTATIAGKKCTGKISIRKEEIFLCQNAKDGLSTYEKLGFKYSWTVSDGSMVDKFDVKGLILHKIKPKGFKEPESVRNYVELPRIDSYPAKRVDKNTIKVGCTPVSREVYLEIGYKMDWIE